MGSVAFEVVLLVFGAIALCIGLFGDVETQWFKVGSRSLVTRTSSIVVGTLLIGVALIKAEILPFGNAGKVEQLTKQNAALQAKMIELEAKLTQRQATMGAYEGLLKQMEGDLSNLGNDALLKQYNEAVASLAERAAASIAAIGDPEKMKKLDPSGEVTSADGDNSISTARSIALGQRVEGEIRPYTDRDYYKVQIPPNVTGPLRVILRKIDPHGLATEIVVYDQNEEVIGRKDSILDPTVSFTVRRPRGNHIYFHVASQGLPSVYSFKPQQGPYEVMVRAE